MNTGAALLCLVLCAVLLPGRADEMCVDDPDVTPCTDGQYYDGSACQACPAALGANCVTCSSATTCTSCPSGEYLFRTDTVIKCDACTDGAGLTPIADCAVYANGAVPTSVDNCGASSTWCAQCSEGFENLAAPADGSSTSPCAGACSGDGAAEGCKFCDSTTTSECDECKDGYSLVSNACIKCSTNCVDCDTAGADGCDYTGVTNGCADGYDYVCESTGSGSSTVMVDSFTVLLTASALIWVFKGI